MGRPRLHDEALRDRLLSSAAATVTSTGVRSLSLRALATQARTSTAAVYSLFGGKPGLVTAVYQRAFTRFGEQLALAGVSDDPVEDIVRLGLAYRDGALADPNGYLIMFGDEVRPSEVEPEVARAGASTFEPLLDAVRRAVRAGAFPASPPPESIATALWANVHGLVSLELGDMMPPSAGDAAGLFVTAVRANVAGWVAMAGRPDR
ncbi:TetR/AcrR family transcriptional regulator [Jiangella alkaliphila]|uniref:DNA-binding transcriptional regulator, AcrR family n=1 Tax=Jiangella alkaliphila TaxID=419479 RepID=A0A1H2I6W6_9ACTN|nr:TetR-like C-terminal domain-containing protein [Jiangella alkaliphila]SDU39870.1 DNA-binding transcriptional regulator, AcrR family [Jiangella alkaliphila]